MEPPRDATLVPLAAVKQHSVMAMRTTHILIPMIGMRIGKMIQITSRMVPSNIPTFMIILQPTIIMIQLNTLSHRSLNWAN